MNPKNIASIYILRQGGSLTQHIAQGSGIVGRPNPGGLTLIYFEGNLLDAPAMRAHEGRIECAARRLFEDIPTTALLYVDAQTVEASLLAVGEVEWDPEAETCRITIDPARTDLVADYLGQGSGHAA